MNRDTQPSNAPIRGIPVDQIIYDDVQDIPDDTKVILMERTADGSAWKVTGERNPHPGGKLMPHQQRIVDEAVKAVKIDPTASRGDVSLMAAFTMTPAALRAFGRYKTRQTTWAPCITCGNDCRTGQCYKCQQKSKIVS